jgi:hypothetical protein
MTLIQSRAYFPAKGAPLTFSKETGPFPKPTDSIAVSALFPRRYGMRRPGALGTRLARSPRAVNDDCAKERGAGAKYPDMDALGTRPVSP